MTTAEESIDHWVDGEISHIRLNRPDVANALDPAMIAALDAAVSSTARSDARAALVTGAGTRFCGGGDIRSFLGAEDRAEHVRGMAHELGRVLGDLARLPMPVVAAVQGAVSGGGLAVILHSDVVVAASNTRFSMGYAAIGVTPDCGVSYWLPRTVGQQRALDLAVTGRVLSASEAEAWGLVSRVVPDDDLHEAVLEVARRCAAYPAAATARTRGLMRGSWGVDRDASVADEAESIAELIVTAESEALLNRFVGR